MHEERIYNPPPDVIQRECARIRDGWNDIQRRQRRGELHNPYTVPEVKVLRPKSESVEKDD